MDRKRARLRPSICCTKEKTNGDTGPDNPFSRNWVDCRLAAFFNVREQPFKLRESQYPVYRLQEDAKIKRPVF